MEKIFLIYGLSDFHIFLAKVVFLNDVPLFPVAFANTLPCLPPHKNAH